MFSKGVAEAALLLVVITTPLLFNVHSNNAFELSKVVVLRALSLTIALAWAVHLLGRRRNGPAVGGSPVPDGGAFTLRAIGRWMKGEPLIPIALLFMGIQLFATAASVAPHISFWGSYPRFQGLYTSVAYITLFFAVLTFVEGWAQIERLLRTVLTVTLPVSLYGIIQHFGSDPVLWFGGSSVRVGSTMGNPIFLGAFLVMVLPLTIYRHIEAGNRIAGSVAGALRAVLVAGGIVNVLILTAAWFLGPVTGTLASLVTLGIWSVEGWLLGKPVLPFLRVGTFSVLLSVQLACLLLTQSRGPWLAMLAGAAFVAVVWAAARGSWKWMSGFICLVAVIGALLLVLNQPGLQPSWGRELPYLGRLAQIFEAAGRVRLHVWEAATDLLAEDRVRTIVGHGPETTHLVVAPYVSPALGLVERRGTLPDRAHNETLDVLVTTGLPGLAAYVLLFGGLLAAGLRCAGVAETLGNRRALVGACLAGGLATVLLTRLLDQSWRLFGIAFPFGILAGTFVYLVGYTLWNASGSGKPIHRWSRPRLLSVILLAALVAHFVEIQFGIAITVTRAYFWIYAATLILLTRHLFRRDETKAAPTSREGGLAFSGHLVGGLTLAFALVTMAFNFSPVGRAFSPGIFWILAFTWIVGLLLGLTDTDGDPAPGLRTVSKICAVYAGTTLLGLSLLAPAYAGGPGRLGDPATMPLLYHSLLLVFLAAIGIVLLRRKRLPTPAWTFSAAAGGVLLAVVTGYVIVATCLNVAKADVRFKQARLLSTHPGQVDRAVDLTRLAIRLQPARDVYRSFLGQLVGRKAENATESALRDELFREARSSLLTSKELSPLDAHHDAALAGLHRSWAHHTEDQLRTRSLLGRAVRHYGEALERYPGNVLWWNEKGSIHRLLGDYDRSRESYEHSLKLDDSLGRTHWHLGELYSAQGRWEDAAKAYGRAISRNPGMVDGFRGLARAYFQLGPATESIQVHEHLLTLAPDDLAARQRLAQLYASAGHFALALAHAERALELAPTQAKPAIERMLEELRNHERRTNP